MKDGVDSLAARIAGPVIAGPELTGAAATGTNPTPAARGLTATFAAITKAAPNARVFVVGYPTIMPSASDTPAAGCFRAQIEGTSLDTLRLANGFPFADVDVRYLHSIEKALDAAIRLAADTAGFRYISLLAGSGSHSACAPPDESYINGISLQATKNFSVALSAGALHPNARGASFMADRVAAEIARAFTPTEEPATPEPSVAVSPVLWTGIAALLIALVIGAVAVVRRKRRRSGDSGSGETHASAPNVKEGPSV